MTVPQPRVNRRPFWLSFGSLLVPFWLPFGSILAPKMLQYSEVTILHSFLVTFLINLLPFWLPLVPFGVLLAHFWLPLAHFWLPLAHFLFPSDPFWLLLAHHFFMWIKGLFSTWKSKPSLITFSFSFGSHLAHFWLPLARSGGPYPLELLWNGFW